MALHSDRTAAAGRAKTCPGLPSRREAGVTLVELLMVLFIASVLLGLGLPSFEGSIGRHHVEGTAAQLETELQYARSLAVARNEPVRVHFEQQGSLSCYVIHTGGARDCGCLQGTATACRNGAEALRTELFGVGSRLSVLSNSPSIAYWPHNGTVTPTATVAVQHRDGASAKLVVNIMGRVRACSDTPGLGGYPKC